MTKAADAFRTISEVASDLNVPKHVLRFWEAKFPQIRPMKRGGGRRYYRPEDLELLRGIRHLLHAEGYTIKGVQKILREQGVDQVKAAAARETPVSRRAAKAGKQPAAAVKVAAPATAARGDLKALLSQAVVELEACRRLLKGQKPEAAAPRAPRRPAARG